MPISLSPSYYQAGSTGEHELYPVTPEEDRNLPFGVDSTYSEEESEKDYIAGLELCEAHEEAMLSAAEEF